MIIAGLIIVSCWFLVLYNITKDDPNDIGLAMMAVLITGVIMNMVLISVGHLIEAVFGE
jgi:hypothetical protein